MNSTIGGGRRDRPKTSKGRGYDRGRFLLTPEVFADGSGASSPTGSFLSQINGETPNECGKLFSIGQW
jgi:hypothetical protein